MGKKDFLDKLKGIPRPKMTSLLDKPTRIPPQLPNLVERRTPQSAFRAKKKEEKQPPQRPTSRSSITPGVLEEVSARVERIDRLIGEWNDAKDPKTGEPPSELFRFGREAPGAHLRGKKKLSILIVEPRKFFREAIEEAIEETVPAHFSKTTLKDCDAATCFNYAVIKLQQMAEVGGYDLVFVAHKIHENAPTCKETESQFLASMQPVGYTLMEILRSETPNTVVIGTASPADLNGTEMEPDFTLDKYWGQAQAGMQKIMEQLRTTGRTG